jgi:hypothetical protein
MISGYMDAEALERSWTGPVLAKSFDKETLARRLAQVLVLEQASSHSSAS